MFSNEIIAGNYKVKKHVIKIKDSSSIKQVPRRILLQMTEEVNKIIKEMKDQSVIEESTSPWISVILVKKMDG